MNSKVAREILNAHGDMLAKGQDTTQTMCELYPELETFFLIAQGMSEVLEMVPVSAEFLAHMQSLFLDTATPEPVLVDQDNRRTWMVGGVAVGSALTGLAAYAFHRLRQEPEAATVAQAA